MTRQKLKPDQKVVFFGCGAVAKCCIHYFRYFFKYNPSQLYLVDKDPYVFEFPTIQQAVNQGAHTLVFNLRTQTIGRLFSDILKLKPYDIIVDLTTNTPSLEIFTHCRLYNLIYINTSMESEEPINLNNPCYANDSIFLQHVNLHAIADKTKDDEAGNATTLVEFGMNPGLISVFVKTGILDIAKMTLRAQYKSSKRVDRQLYKYYKARKHKRLAELLKIRIIHCSEIDTQVPLNPPKQPFFNTWSCVGLIEEGVESAEIQIGTHEEYVPFNTQNVNSVIPQLVITRKAGKDIKFRSVVPSHIEGKRVVFTNIVGRCIPHGEGLSLNRYLGSFRYAPTMHYVYQLNPQTDKMLTEMSSQQLVKIAQDPKKWKVLNMHDDKVTGYDNVGAMFALEENPITKDKTPYCFWTGSILNSEYTTGKLGDKYFGPTVIQVMAGVLSGLNWCVRNKNKGLVFGEHLDDQYILKLAKPFLGTLYSGPVDENVKLRGLTLTDLIVEGQDDKYSSVDDL